MRDISPRITQPELEVCFEQGAVPSRCECLRFEAEGVVFHSPFRFEVLSGVLLSLHRCGTVDCRGDVTVEGVVIDCRTIGPGEFETTVFFDLPLREERPGYCALLPAAH
jgi:hypothetical protein